ncbi:MAG TPA: hypothetical protein VFK02_19865 [Kofleriaceae bacterium]|nr:hypothetical protein [Kofleriaceae bacterium]
MQRAEARLDLGKLRFLDVLPANAVKDPSALASVVVRKLGEKLDAETPFIAPPRHQRAMEKNSVQVGTKIDYQVVSSSLMSLSRRTPIGPDECRTEAEQVAQRLR